MITLNQNQKQIYPVFLGARLYEQDFEQLVYETLASLIHFQVRAFKKNSMKQRRRVVFGFNEVKRYAQVDKVLMIVLAADTNIQIVQENEWLRHQYKCHAPIVVALDRRAMGSLLGCRSEASICAVISADGAYESFHKVIERNKALEESFTKELTIDHFWFVCYYGHEGLLGYFKEMPGLNCELVFEGMTPLFVAIKGLGNVAMITRLIDEFECDVSLRDFGLNTALHLACERGCVNILKVISNRIPNKESARMRNIKGQNVLQLAIASRKNEIIEIVSKITFWAEKEKDEAVMCACRHTSATALNELMKNEFIPPRGALVEAAKHGSLECVQVLVKLLSSEIHEARAWAKKIGCEPMGRFLSSFPKF